MCVTFLLQVKVKEFFCLFKATSINKNVLRVYTCTLSESDFFIRVISLELIRAIFRELNRDG